MFNLCDFSNVHKTLVEFGISKRSDGKFCDLSLIDFYICFREMVPHRLASVSETNEENGDGSTEKSALQPLQKNNKTHTTRNSNQLHVTINTTPEEIECDDNSNGNAGPAIRRPSALAQDILSTRRPSSIMAAIRSPKQFVNRMRRE